MRGAGIGACTVTVEEEWIMSSSRERERVGTAAGILIFHRGRTVASTTSSRWCKPASNGFAETTMFSSLPPEILDFIVDHLHDEPSTLKSCCLVSKSWIPRIRRILFAKVEFSSDRCPIQLWMNAFPDPCNSPAHHTHVLHFIDHNSIAAASMVAFAWVQRFCHINKLRIPNTSGSLLAPRAPGPLVQLRGLSPTLTSLHLLGVSAPLSEVLDLICSFPLLEDLFLHFVTTQGGSDRRYIPPTSPSLTGTLHMIELSPSLTRGLLDLPNGLHFSRVTTWFPGGANSPEVDLISKCRNTLEDLTIDFSSPSSFYLCLYGWLIPDHRDSSWAARPLRGQKAQICGISMYRTKHSIDYRHASNCQTHSPPANNDHGPFL